MATDTRTGNVVSNYYGGGYYDWKCQQVVTTSQTNDKVTVTIKINMLGIDSLHFYQNDVHSSLYIDYNRVNYVTTSPDKYISPNEAWNRITRTVTYNRSTSAATHVINGNVQVVGGAWEGASTTYNNRLTITIPALPSYTITYNANGGSNAPATGKKWYNQAYTVSSTKPTRSGYTFVNWKISETGNTVGAGGTITANSNANYTLVAQWTANKFTLSYNANGGVQSSAGAQNYPISTTKDTASYNSTMNLYNIGTFGLSKTGYHTDPETAWNTKADGSGTSYNENTNYSWTTFGSTTASQTNITLYANWKVNTYTLTANANGGSISSTSGWTGTGTQATKNVNYNATYNTFPGISRTNYTFDGWFTAKTGGTQVTSNTKMGAANTTIYAHWTLNHISATITNVVAKRDNANHTGDDSGNIAYLTFNYNKNDDSDISRYSIQLSEQDGSEVNTIAGDISTTSGVIEVWSSFTIDIDKSYDVTISLCNSNDQPIQQNTQEYISKAFFIMDINAKGTAISFGQTANDYIRTNDTSVVSGKTYYTYNSNTNTYDSVASPSASQLSNYYEDNNGFYCATNAYFKDNADVFRALFDFLYPVGSYYETSDSSFNPNVTWGGTWTKLGEGQVLLSAGSTYSVGTSYGGNSKSYTPAGTVGNTTLNESQIPKHTHGEKSLSGTFNIRKSSNGTAAGNTITATSGIVSKVDATASAYADAYSSHNPNAIERVTISATHTHDNFGGGGAHNHGFTGTAASINVMQSSVAVWIWHRTA